MKRLGRWLLAGLLGWTGATLHAGAAAASVDAPELARPGTMAVGVMRVSVPVGLVTSLEAPAVAGEPAPGIDRRIDALLWYPAALTAEAGGASTAREIVRELRTHPWRPLPTSPLRVSVPSVAVPDAPLGGQGRLPVVVLSHGLLNWLPALGYLAEHLASRGYAVLGLEHEDERASEPLRSALYLRPLDQAAALRELQRLDATPGQPFHQRLAADRVALLGYSMGGYGALVTAGARVAADGMAFRYVPGAALAVHAQPLGSEQEPWRARVAAVVAIAPWGGQASMGALKAAGLRGVTAPTLVIAGDQDDISGYADGVRSTWQAMVSAPRWLLVYENARHNIALRSAPLVLQGSFGAWSSVEEPVWRRDRILDINRHFVTAFLDHVLRGQAGPAVFLNPAVSRANDGVWPQPFGAPATGQYAPAPAGEVTHWAGFQRRWALGLRLERLPAAVK